MYKNVSFLGFWELCKNRISILRMLQQNILRVLQIEILCIEITLKIKDLHFPWYFLLETFCHWHGISWIHCINSEDMAIYFIILSPSESNILYFQFFWYQSHFSKMKKKYSIKIIFALLENFLIIINFDHSKNWIHYSHWTRLTRFQKLFLQFLKIKV